MRSSVPPSSPSCGAMAMPMLVDGTNSLPSMRERLGHGRRGCRARGGRSRCGRRRRVWRTTNSSPPSRATKWPRAACWTRWPASTSSSVAGRMAERVVDHLELVEVEAMQREQAAVALGRAEQMLELLLEHGAVGQPGQHVVEGELGDALLALGDLADHFVEAVGEPRKLVLAAHPDLDMLARGEAPGGFVEPRERLRDSRPPPSTSRRRRASSPSSVMTPSASCSLRASASASRLGISEQQDRALAVARRSAAAWRARSSVCPPTVISKAALLPTCACGERSATRARAPTCCPMLRTSGHCRRRSPPRAAGLPTAARGRASRERRGRRRTRPSRSASAP